MIPHRHIRLSGIPNLRDLGGYKTQCGRQVAYGKLFRSGQLTGLDEDGWSFMDSVGLSRIYDFRRPDEIDRTPTKLPPDSNIEIINLEITPGNHGGIANRIAKGGEQTPDDIERKMRNLYLDYVRDCTDDFADFIHRLLTLKGDESVLFHCMAGKDRTGFAAAILLSCLNVDRHTIEQEYLLTKNYFIPEKEIVRLKKRYADQFDAGQDSESVDHDVFYPVFDTRLIYLQAALGLIDDQWGSIEAYITRALKLDARSLEKLQAIFLTDDEGIND
jgi:protein-tyrosine phosphatase